MPGQRNKPGWSVAVREENPTFGDQVHLDATGPEGVRLWGHIEAFQNDMLVYSQVNGLGPWYYAGDDAPFSLGPTASWSGGAAIATAKVCEHVRGELRVRATIQFEIGA